MEMNQVRYVLAVCEHRNFTHAARACHVAQPSLTTAIKKLEAELGGPLFLRDRSGCQLTPLGRLVRPRFERLVQEAKAAKAEAVRHVRLDRVPLAVGLGETIGPARVVDAVARFRSAKPQADIELIVAPSDDLLQGLREGRFDVAVTASEASADLYRADPLYTEGYRAAMGVDHPLAASDRVPLARLGAADLLDRPNCEMREALHAACADEGVSLYAAYRSNRVDWLLRLAAAGTGVVVLPETAVPDDPRLVARPLGDVVIERTVKALRHRHQPSRPEAEALVRALARGRRPVAT